MKPHLSFLSPVGFLFFLAGILIGVSLSAVILWGEMEVRLITSYPPSKTLQMKCPFMLSPAESGKVEAVIVNSTDQEVNPMITEDINNAGDSGIASPILLAPMASRTLEWTVDGSNVIFGRLILINIFQSPYRDNPSYLGSCSILSFSLFGLTGMQTFNLLFAGSLIGILLGGGLWLYARRQLNDSSPVTQAGVILGVMTLVVLLSSILHWWGLTLFLDALILLCGGIFITEFALFPKRDKP